MHSGLKFYLNPVEMAPLHTYAALEDEKRAIATAEMIRGSKEFLDLLCAGTPAVQACQRMGILQNVQGTLKELSKALESELASVGLNDTGQLENGQEKPAQAAPRPNKQETEAKKALN